MRPEQDIAVTTPEALTLLAHAHPPVTAHHIREWARARDDNPARLDPVGRRGRYRLWAWSDLLRLERDTRSRRGASAD